MTISRYRLLVLDLDGTLLDHKSELSPNTEAAVKKAQGSRTKSHFCHWQAIWRCHPLCSALRFNPAADP